PWTPEPGVRPRPCRCSASPPASPRPRMPCYKPRPVAPPRGSAADEERSDMRTTTTPLLAGVLAAAVLSLPAGAAAELAPEQIGNAFELPATPGPHWFWASDILLHRTTLFDAGDGRMLGTISSGAA